MKKNLLLLVLVLGGTGLLTSCTKTVYVDRTVTVVQKPRPVVRSAPAPAPRPRVDNPDNFDAVGKPTTYSGY